MAIKKKYIKVFMDISKQLPEDLKSRLIKKVPANQTIKTVLNHAIEDKDFPEEKKERLQNILNSGELDQEIEEVDKDVEREIDEWYEKEIDRAIKLGKLPEDRELISNLKKNGQKKGNDRKVEGSDSK